MYIYKDLLYIYKDLYIKDIIYTIITTSNNSKLLIINYARYARYESYKT